MEFEGIIKKIYKEEVIKTKKDVDLKLQVVTIEENSDTEYPAAVAVTFVGDKVSLLSKFKEGQNVRVGLNLRVNENKDGTKAFTSINARRIQSLDDAPAADDTEEDLPF